MGTSFDDYLHVGGPCDIHGIIRFWGAHRRLELEGYQFFARPESFAYLPDTSRLSWFDCHEIGYYLGLGNHRFNAFRNVVQFPSQTTRYHCHGLSDANVPQRSCCYALVEFLQRASRSDLLLERSAAWRSVLDPDCFDLIHLLAYSGHDQWPGIHQESRVHAGGQDCNLVRFGHPIYISRQLWFLLERVS